MPLTQNKIGVLGLARSGIAAGLKLTSLGYTVIMNDLKSEVELLENEFVSRDELNYLQSQGVVELGYHSNKLMECELVILSPGIPLNNEFVVKLKSSGIKVISEIELGFLLKSPESKIIAVTGSNGKSTTVSLIHHILTWSGYNSILAGNIGMAFTRYPIEKSGIDYIVLELSSFQLDLIDNFKAETAVILNITPDHLDRYKSFQDYKKSKFRIFKNQGPEDMLVINGDDDVLLEIFKMKISQKIKYFSFKSKLADIYYENSFIKSNNRRINTSNFNLKGLHNIYNLMAAILILENIDITDKEIEEALLSFKSLPHRLEYVDKIGDVVFYNDSKATNCDSVLYALDGFQQKIHLILGGYDKGEDFEILISSLAAKCSGIYLVGDTKERMYQTFRESDLLNPNQIQSCNDLEEAVFKAWRNAQRGELVLLSPACASFDMFKNYEHRGNFFKKIVRSIKNEKKI